MLRTFLLLMSMLLAVGLPQDVQSDVGEEVVAQLVALDDCHCCSDGDEPDCCADDLGACCSARTVATPVTAMPERPQDARAMLEFRSWASLSLLLPRDNGPPPLPPPIV